MATLKDISILAGVPISTVSYVLNRKGKAIKPKHKRILEIAKEMNYVPNQKAVSLVSGRANNIGMILPQDPRSIFDEPFFTELLFRISSKLSQQNMGLTLYSCQKDPDMLYQYMLSGNADGFIWYQYSIPEAIREAVNRRKIPLVLLIHKDDDLNYLAIDDYSGQMKALQHLYQLNHRKILFLSNGESSIRRKAYVDFVAEKGLPYRVVIEPDDQTSNFYKLLDNYISRYGKDFTAIAAENDAKAISAMQVMTKWNIKVPDEISIIGYDDIPMASSITPPLTTVQHSIGQMVDDSVNIIFDCLDNGKTELVQKTYQHDVIVRQSTALCQAY